MVRVWGVEFEIKPPFFPEKDVEILDKLAGIAKYLSCFI